MSTRTANALVLAVLLLGGATILVTNRSGSFAVTYRRLWGLGMLCAGAGILAELAPQVVGPFLILVGIGYAYINRSKLGGLAQTAAQASTTSTAQEGGTAP